MQLSRVFGFGLVLTFVGLVSAQPIEVTMWDFLSGGDGVRMKQLVQEFNESQDRVRVESTTLEWGTPFYTKVRTAITAGQQPDVVTYHLSRFPSAVPNGLLGPISEEELASVGLSTEDFFPLLTEKATFEGELYGVPLDTHPWVLFYNKDLLSEAGLLGDDGQPQGIEGIENFNDALRTVKEETGAYGMAFPTGGSATWRTWYTLLKQQNGEAIEDGQVVFGEEGQRALETMANWTEEGLALRNLQEGSQVIAQFTSGRAAFMLNGVWNVTTLEDLVAEGELPFEYGVMPLPALYDNQSNWADSHAFAIPNSEKNPISDEKRQAVLEFIAFVNKNSLVWASGGHIPAYLPVVNSDEYQTMEPNVHYAPAAENVVYDPDVAIAGAAGPLQEAAANFFSPAINGQLPVERALEMFKQELEGLLKNSSN